MKLSKFPSLKGALILIGLFISIHASTYGQINYLMNGNFELGPNNGWIESSTNFGTPLCELASCGNGTGTGPNSGLFWAWFGGHTNGTEIGSISQTVTIPASSYMEISFYLEQIVCDSPSDFLELTIDGDQVFYADGASPLCGVLGYSYQVVNITQYADGLPHVIAFNSTTISLNQGATNFYIDDVSMHPYATLIYNEVKGKAFADLNSNGIQDALEPGLPYINIIDIVDGYSTFTNINGDYNLHIYDTGSFTVTAGPINNYNVQPASHNVSFNAMLMSDTGNNFIYEPTVIANDISVGINPIGLFRSGFSAGYNINYTNCGTTILNPQIVFYPDNNISFTSSNPTPSLITADSIVWNIGSTNIFQSGNINVIVQVNLGLSIGTLINSTVKAEPVAGDANTINNYDAWEIFTTGSFDPNDILVSRDKILNTQILSPPFLDYIIRFQNTGNDTAFTVRIENTLPPTLNYNTFEFVTSSHNVQIESNPQTSHFTFLFENILLADSNINEPESHGFVRYRVKPLNTLIVGDSILNDAAIYFDFNLPVLTNTAVTEIVLPTSLNDFSDSDFKVNVYPNPVSDEINIILHDLKGENLSIELFNVYGKKIKTLSSGNVNNEQLKVVGNIKEFSGGLYFLQLKTDSAKAISRIIKM